MLKYISLCVASASSHTCTGDQGTWEQSFQSNADEGVIVLTNAEDKKANATGEVRYFKSL